jgi:hypothetical protein
MQKWGQWMDKLKEQGKLVGAQPLPVNYFPIQNLENI